MPYTLAIDQGGHASRAIVFDHQGRLIAKAEAAIQTHTPQSGWVEHDAEKLVAATRQAIEQAVAQLGADKRHLQAAGLATQRSSIACWDRLTGRPLGPILSWQDRRQAEWLEQFSPQRRQIHDSTGLFLSPHYGASKLRWCLDHLPEVSQAAQAGTLAMGPLASFLTWQLLAERPLVADPANASRTLLWNLQRGDWDDQLLQLFQIPRQALPACVSSRGEFGHLAVDDLRLPLQVITGDQPGALFAWGRPDPALAYITLGTGAFIQRPMATPLMHERLLSGIGHRDAEQSWYTLEGTVNGAARALHWYAQRHGIADIETCVAQALASDEPPALFINSVAGLGSPDWISDLEPRFEGNDSRFGQLRGVIESIAFLIQRNLDTMAQVVTAPERIIISGGLSRLDDLCQAIADLSGVTVMRPGECEATARGLAWLLTAPAPAWGMPEPLSYFNPRSDAGILSRYRHWERRMAQLRTDKT